MFAKYEANKRGGYDVLARYNEKGLFRIVESLPTRPMAELFVKQLSDDPQLRHSCLRETKGWDFEKQKPVQAKKPREKREPQTPVKFSWEA